jgi:hypothetical protein
MLRPGDIPERQTARRRRSVARCEMALPEEAIGIG